MNPLASLVIPTYNRPDRLGRALQSLETQTMAADRFEVIVVDDGSDRDMGPWPSKTYPFAYRFVRKENSGATETRRRGVQESTGDLLVFMDDDVTLAPAALAAVTDSGRNNAALVLGNLVDRVPEPGTVFARRQAAKQQDHETDLGERAIHFTHCNTQFLAVQRGIYDALGGIQDPTGGWPNWDDLDFGYRAHLAGYPLIKCGEAAAFHWDHSLGDMRVTCRRWYRAAHAAARLFEKYPELAGQLPMFSDKLPIAWRVDSRRTIIRKALRSAASTKISIWLLEKMAGIFERSGGIMQPDPFYRWIIGGCLYNGLRDGRRTLSNV